MRRQLQKIYWTGILITLIMAFAAIAAAAKVKIDDTRRHLTAMLMAASEWTLDSNDDLQSLADSIAQVSQPMRITFLLDTGVILADSMADSGREGVFSKDREIVEAKDGSVGRDMRMSAASSAFVLYMARKLSPRLILRVSYPVFEAARLILIYGAVLLVLFLVLYLIQRRSLSRYAGKQKKQMDDLRKLLDGEIDHVEAAFEEYQPSLNAVSYRIQRLKEDYLEIEKNLNLRSDFVANASHELRSPLTSVRGFAELLHEGMAQTPEEQDLCFQMILSGCDHMLEVIEEILLLGKAEKEETAGDLPAIQAADVAGEVIRSLALQAERKEITMQVEGNTKVHAAEKDLWEIFYNLIDNAIRYGRRGGQVRVVMSEGQIAVEDDGIGISSEDLPRIFEPFYRSDEVRERAGTGLGLPIVKAITEKCGGRISVESSYGEGSRFMISFPSGMKDVL